ncbi:hypothetical protein EJB05_04113, partial [Eragrostis curvula]
MAPVSPHAHGLREVSETVTPPLLDLDLRLRPPVAVISQRGDDANVVGLDHALANFPRMKALQNGANYMQEWVDTTSKCVGAGQLATAPDAPAPVLLRLFTQQPHAFDVVNNVGSGSADPRQRAQSQEAEAEEAALELTCKRARSEPPPSAAGAPRVLPTDAGATEPAWVRAELLPRLGFPADLRLHFVEDKLLQDSDLKASQNRFLIPFAASHRLRVFLSAAELEGCGDDSSGGRRPRPAAAARTPHARDNGKKRAAQIKYPGVPVLVHQRDVEREPTPLKLNTFHSTTTMVINGAGYRDIVKGSGFEKRDRVEVWAFRRPQDQKLCLVVAKRDVNRWPAINQQE